MPRKLLVPTFGGITVRFKPLIALHSRGTERGQEGPTAKFIKSLFKILG